MLVAADPAEKPTHAGGLVYRIRRGRPEFLLVTDNYSRLWRATPLSPGPQASYDVLPADWVLRAIPLQAGTHHIRLRYSPRSVPIGFAVTGLTVVGLVGAAFWTRRRHRFASRSI